MRPNMNQQRASLFARVWTVWRRPDGINRGRMLVSNVEKCRTFSSNLLKSKVEGKTSETPLKMHMRHSSNATHSQAEPLCVLITGAAGQIGYSLIYMVARGGVFGFAQPLILHLLDLPFKMKELNGVVMEIRDCVFPLVKRIVATDDPALAFKDVEVAFLAGALPRTKGMKRKDLLIVNAKIFEIQGKMLDKHAKKTVKVIVVANPANTNALICMKCAPSIPPQSIHAMTRLDQSRAVAQIAIRLNIPVTDVKNVIVWGNHSGTQFPDVSHAMVNINGETVNAVTAINDNTWLTTEFLKTVQNRGSAIIAARNLSSAMSAAKGACDHVRDLWSGTPEDSYVSMGVISDGSYGTPKDVIFSFPCTIQNKEWKIVQGLPIDDFARCMLDQTGKELIEEREEAFCVLRIDTVSST